MEKGVFPVAEETLCGVLSDLDAVLRGILEDPDSTLYGVTDAFSLRDYARDLYCCIAIAHELTVEAIKEVRVSGTVCLDASSVRACSNTAIDRIDAPIAVAALLDMAVQRTVALHSSVQLSAAVEAVLNKSAGALHDGMKVSGHLAAYASRQAASDISAAIALLAQPLAVSRTVDAVGFKVCTGVSAALDASLQKVVVPQSSAMMLRSSLHTVVTRYRQIGDLSGLTIADVSGWTLNDFYWIKE